MKFASSVKFEVQVQLKSLFATQVTRRQVRRFQERPEPADAEDSSDGLPEKEKKQDNDIEEDSMHVPALRLPTNSLDERPLTDLEIAGHDGAGVVVSGGAEPNVLDTRRCLRTCTLAGLLLKHPLPVANDLFKHKAKTCVRIAEA